MAGVEPLPDSICELLCDAFLEACDLADHSLFRSALAAFALQYFHGELTGMTGLSGFFPLIISSGGNSGSQSSTLIISALASREIESGKALYILRREFLRGSFSEVFLPHWIRFGTWVSSQFLCGARNSDYDPLRRRMRYFLRVDVAIVPQANRT